MTCEVGAIVSWRVSPGASGGRRESEGVVALVEPRRRMPMPLLSRGGEIAKQAEGCTLEPNSYIGFLTPSLARYEAETTDN